MLVKSNPVKEQKIIAELTASDEALMRQHKLFQAEMQFKQELINKRKAYSLTQKDISERSGLSQQAISRLEKGNGGTIETIIKYLSAMGCSLTLKEI
ncbi:MAG: helix-turn-helix transcriptional regulator [Anaerovibrio sp.]|uniref:helix-turn-helix domain-containing protein n=1 Tax=uncultured Anaerovibrio sp. TaxID=361586 RepID=UPI0025F7BC2F|nr:helix-turn-helix transcriptional regulator [uncultured Anaerovibrio sp.]MBQ3853272.1 helix-turn-helix transcriptional regulator [Anaerovibrio sp.]